MREILFRAKRIDSGEWVEGNLVFSLDADEGWRAIIIPIRNSYMFSRGNEDEDLGFENWHRVDFKTVCQYTGLTDKKRKKIFEGDIVSFRHSKPDFDIESEYPFFHSKEYNRNYVIEFSNTTTHYGLRFKNGSITFPCKQGTLFNGDCKVIGNIFDNPELLKVGGTDE